MSNNTDKTPMFKAMFHCAKYRAGGNATSCGARGALEPAKKFLKAWAKRDMALDLKPGGQFLVRASKTGI